MPRTTAPPTTTPLRTRLWVSVFLIVTLLFVGSILAVLFGASTDEVGANTAVIRITGVITTAGSDGLFGEGVASSGTIVDALEQARDDDSITGVILEIDSPGGSPVASDEIGRAVRDVRASGKPVVAWIRETGASGAYWVATSADHIVANRMSVTGSIGVYGSYLGFAEFLDDWNLTYYRLVSGERKDIGDPFTDLTPQQRAFLQGKLDMIHQEFINEVATNRNLSTAEVARLADGSFLLGGEAFAVGLIDELGGEPEAIAWLEATTGETVTMTVFEPERTFFEELFGVTGRAREPTVEDLLRERMLAEERGLPQLR